MRKAAQCWDERVNSVNGVNSVNHERGVARRPPFGMHSANKAAAPAMPVFTDAPAPPTLFFLNFFGCGYFLATRKALKNKAIVSVAARLMVGKCRVIEGKT